MSDKVTLNPITTGYRSLQQYNADLEIIEQAFDNTISRDGSAPNQMEAVLDMNGNRIINLGAPISGSDAVRLYDLLNLGVDAGTGPAIDFSSVLAAQTANPTASYVRTAGFHSAGDGGGALYVAASGTAPGAFQTNLGQWYQLVSPYDGNARCYGAVGDSVTDDSVALQAWLNSAASALVLPPAQPLKTYLINTPLTMTWQAYGDGNQTSERSIYCGATILAGPSFPAGAWMIQVKATAVNWYAISLDGGRNGAGSNYAYGGLGLGHPSPGRYDCYRNRVYSCHIAHCYGKGLAIYSGNENTILCPDIGQWSNHDPEYYDLSAYTGDGLYVNYPDNEIIGGVVRWCGIPIHFDSGSGTTWVKGIHPYNGNAFRADTLTLAGSGHSYDPLTGFLTLNLTAACYLIPGQIAIVQALTGTGAGIATILSTNVVNPNGSSPAPGSSYMTMAGTGGTTVVLQVTPGLSISSLTGGHLSTGAFVNPKIIQIENGAAGIFFVDCYLDEGLVVGNTDNFRIYNAFTLQSPDATIFTGTPDNPTAISAITKANPGQITSTAHGLSTNNVVYLSGISGMTQLNGRTFKAQVVDANNFTLKDLFGTVIDTTGMSTYTSGGSAQLVHTPYDYWLICNGQNHPYNLQFYGTGESIASNNLPAHPAQTMLYGQTNQIAVPVTSWTGDGAHVTFTLPALPANIATFSVINTYGFANSGVNVSGVTITSFDPNALTITIANTTNSSGAGGFLQQTFTGSTVGLTSNFQANSEQQLVISQGRFHVTPSTTNPSDTWFSPQNAVKHQFIVGGAAANNQVTVNYTGSGSMQVTANSLTPGVTNSTTLGSPSLAWSNVYGQNAYTTTSDIRVKFVRPDNIPGLEFWEGLEEISFTWREEPDGDLHYGHSAQQVRALLDSMGIGKHAMHSDGDVQALSREEWWAIASKSFKQLKAEIDDIKRYLHIPYGA